MSTTTEDSDKAKLLSVYTVLGPYRETCKIQYYANGSIRFRVVGRGPMALTESFLSGQNKDVVLRIANLDDNLLNNIVAAIVKEKLSEWKIDSPNQQFLIEQTTFDQFNGEIKFQIKFAKRVEKSVGVFREEFITPSISGFLIYRRSEPEAIEQIVYPAPTLSTKITANGSWEIDLNRLHYYGRAGYISVEELSKLLKSDEERPRNCQRPIKLPKMPSYVYVNRMLAAPNGKPSHPLSQQATIIKVGQEGEYTWARLSDGSILRADHQWWASVDPASRSAMYQRLNDANPRFKGCIPIWRQDPSLNTSESCVEIRFPGESDYEYWGQLFYDFDVDQEKRPGPRPAN